MTAGYQPQPIREYAAVVELAAARRRMLDAESNLKRIATQAMHDGVRSATVADALKMSRATLYRWLKRDD